jgi:hypothetical protein
MASATSATTVGTMRIEDRRILTVMGTAMLATPVRTRTAMA